MSEHVERDHGANWRVPFFENGPVQAARPVERKEGRTWPLAAVIFGSTIASYVVTIGAIYLGLTALL
jgi:hypothetical protein